MKIWLIIESLIVVLLAVISVLLELSRLFDWYKTGSAFSLLWFITVSPALAYLIYKLWKTRPSSPNRQSLF